MDQQLRIDQNRAQTRELLKRRLLQSHRQHTAVAEKRIFKRQVLRTVRNIAIAALATSALAWTAVTYWGVQISIATSPVAHPVPPVTNSLNTALPAEAPKPAVSVPEIEVPPEVHAAEEVSAAQTELRFESELTTTPVHQPTKPRSTLTSPLEKP